MKAEALLQVRFWGFHEDAVDMRLCAFVKFCPKTMGVARES